MCNIHGINIITNTNTDLRYISSSNNNCYLCETLTGYESQVLYVSKPQQNTSSIQTIPNVQYYMQVPLTNVYINSTYTLPQLINNYNLHMNNQLTDITSYNIIHSMIQSLGHDYLQKIVIHLSLIHI